MEVGRFNLSGSSVSGISSSIVWEDRRICFDVGNPFEALKCGTVLITHGHLDHAGGLPQHYNIRKMRGQRTTYIIPSGLTQRFKGVLGSWAGIQEEEYTNPTFIPLDVGQEYSLGSKLWVKPFYTDHRIDSQGYLIVERRKSLKAEYRGLPGMDLGKLRREGVEIDQVIDLPLIAYTGDTRATIFERGEEWLNAEVVITECTFHGEGMTPKQAITRGHVHLDQLVEREAAFRHCGKLVLTHRSKRYSLESMTEAIQATPLADKAVFF
jgi:ribonuclease Z